MTMDRSRADPGGAVGLEPGDPTQPRDGTAIRTCSALGIDVGSVNVKACGLGGDAVRHAVVAHEGDIEAALDAALDALALGDSAAPATLTTGGAGRRRVDVSDVIAPRAVEAALDALGLRPRAVVSLGGEDLVVYILDGSARVQTSYAGNKCASGTGEFFRQQLGRMDLDLGSLDAAVDGAHVLKLSARCSVFMKSDCTHRLNKGEATKGDIALSLSKVMADKVGEFLIKARVRAGQVALVGGVTQNRHLLRFLAEAWPAIEFVVPAEARFFEAFGAAHLARALGQPLPPRGRRLRTLPAAAGTPFAPLASAGTRVRYFPSRRGALRPGGEYVLGVDGGSTTTKVALVDAETLEIAAAHYGRTHGDPVAALKRCLVEVREQVGDRLVAAVMGGARELAVLLAARALRVAAQFCRERAPALEDAPAQLLNLLGRQCHLRSP